MARLLFFAAALVASVATALSSEDVHDLKIRSLSARSSKQKRSAELDSSSMSAPYGMPPNLMSSSSSAVAPNPKQPANPVIAIVTVKCNAPKAAPDANTCLDDYYVRWLEAQGTRVVALPIWWSWEQKLTIVSRVNGVLFPGGGQDGQAFTDYLSNASQIINYALEKPGFFIWGTCMGFQVISIVMSKLDESILTCDYEGMYPSMLPLDFTPYQPKSVLFGKEASEWGVVNTAATTNSTLNFHHCGIDPKNFKPTLADVKVISTNVDINGKPFVSTIEIVDGGKNIFGTQYHPERPPYEFSDDVITHARGTIDLSTYMSRFINERLKLNSQTFESQEDVNRITFDNYVHTNSGWGGGYYWMKL